MNALRRFFNHPLIKIREIVSVAIRLTGIPCFIRNTIAKNKVTILLYHNPKPDILNKHLTYLSKRYNFITMDLLVDAIYSKDWSSIPTKSLILTLDDGHKLNFHLLDVFKKYNVRPTIYLCSQLINTYRYFWFKVPGVKSILLKNCFNSDRLDFLNKNFGYKPQKEFNKNDRQALDIDEILVMRDFVDFQSHTRFHPVLPSCCDNECKEEIQKSKKEIENLSGRECKHFAYPSGYYTYREIEVLKKSGYLSARTIDVGWNGLHANPFTLKVTGITDDASINMLAAQLSGLTMYIRYLMKGSFKGKHPKFKLSEK